MTTVSNRNTATIIYYQHIIVAAAAARNTMDANANETAGGVSENDDGINTNIDTEESVVNENGVELTVFEKKTYVQKVRKHTNRRNNDSSLIASSLFVLQLTTILFVFILTLLVSCFPFEDFIGVPITIFAFMIVYMIASAAGGLGIPDAYFNFVKKATAAETTLLDSLSLLVESLGFLYGIIIDVFPIYGLSWKSYTILGLVITCSVLITIASYGDAIGNSTYIILTALVALGLEIMSVAIRGYIPWVTKRESPKNKGYFQSVMIQIEVISTLLAAFVLLVVFSSPLYACTAGYEQDPSTSCSTDAQITNQNPLSQTDPDNWCHDKCPAAWYSFNPPLTLMYASLVVFLCVLIVPSLVFLKEGKKVKGNIQTKIKSLWVALTRRSLWQMILFTLVFHIMTNVSNPSGGLMDMALMDVNAPNIQIASIIVTSVGIVSIYLYMKFFLKSSRRKLLIAVILLDIVFLLIKLLPGKYISSLLSSSSSSFKI